MKTEISAPTIGCSVPDSKTTPRISPFTVWGLSSWAGMRIENTVIASSSKTAYLNQAFAID
jgi:hypothetical protein